eukprot:764839-Hanusia_phi.AAC.2
MAEIETLEARSLCEFRATRRSTTQALSCVLESHCTHAPKQVSLETPIYRLTIREEELTSPSSHLLSGYHLPPQLSRPR